MTTVAVQYRRGTTAQHSTFTGLVGELTVDTDKDTVVVHDGATAGGFPLQKEIVTLDYSKLSGTVPIWNQNTTGNAATVTNGVYTTGTYANPAWITEIALAKIPEIGSLIETFLTTPSSANLQLAVTGATGTGALVFGTAPTITGLKETKLALPANAIDLALGNYFSKTISVATTLTVSNTPTTNTVASFILDLTNGGAFAITWWTNLKWTGGTAPTFTSAGRDSLGFYTHDAGATWTGLVLGKDIK
jgi:hypothetical protein